MAAEARQEQRTLWIVGTSVSIESGGYVAQLQAAAPDWRLRNLSVGDQTSMMGYLRVLQHRAQFARGDVVVWEYSLLDHLLTQGLFDRGDVRRARRFAWNLLRELGVGLVVLFTPPREDLGARTEIERECAEDAARMGAPWFDLRDAFAELGIDAPHKHYRDDRHPRVDSPAVARWVERLREAIAGAAAPAHALDEAELAEPWQWLDAETLAANAGRGTRTLKNSLMTLEAVPLAVDDRMALPATRRVVALGVVSTHASGGAWCGHPGCPPASTRLPADLSYAFLLRVTGLPCIRAHIDQIVSAPGWAYRNGHWRDYGQALVSEPGPVEVFGALIDTAAHGQPAAYTRPTLAERIERRIRRWWRERR